MSSLKDTTLKWLDYVNAGAKKKFGQNFLVDQSVLDKIVKNAEVEDVSCVEIGPGVGALTNTLLPVVKELDVYEIDHNMVRVLEERFKNENKLSITDIDFLKVNTSDLRSEVVVANLPYYITTPILFKFLEEKNEVDRLIIMVQKEVAERFSAKPNTKDYNALSVILQFKADVEYLFTVNRTAFYPQPRVDSAVVKVKFKQNSSDISEEGFFKFVKTVFAHRRKTMLNNLSSFYNKEFARDVLVKVVGNDSVRSEALSIEQLLEVYKELNTAN